MCDGGGSKPSRRLRRSRALLEEAERGLGALQCSADREDQEADAGKQQRDPDHEAEQRELRCHVARVQRRGQRRVGDPEVAAAVVHRLLRLRVAQRVLRVARRAEAVRVLDRRAGLGDVAAHLRVRQPRGGGERVDAHVLREAACLAAGVDELAGDRAGRRLDRRGRHLHAGRVQLREQLVLRGLVRLDLGRDRRRGHVGRARDLLLLEAVADRRVPVDTHHDRRDTESDQDGGGDNATDLEQLAGHGSLLPSRSPSSACDLFFRGVSARNGFAAIGSEPGSWCGRSRLALRVSR